MKNKTTAKDFEIFRKEAELWINRLGMQDWRIEFNHSDEGGNDCRAWFSANVEGRLGVIGLAVDWSPDEITVERLKVSAFHEVIELLLCPLKWLAECRFCQPEEIPESVHCIIRRLENLFYGNGKKGIGEKV